MGHVEVVESRDNLLSGEGWIQWHLVSIGSDKLNTFLIALHSELLEEWNRCNAHTKQTIQSLYSVPDRH